MRRVFGRRRSGQPEHGSPPRGRVRAVALVSAAMLVLSSGTAPSADSKEWPRLLIANLMTYGSIRIALSGAVLWLEKPHCRGVFAEFRDETDSPLSNRLATLGVDEAGYLRMLVFRDGSGTRQCDN